MTIENIKIEEAIGRVRKLLSEEKGISPALKAAIEVIILALTLVCNRLGINSSNSSKPPSQDPNREKGKKRNGKKPGGQKGHAGKNLEKVDDPDESIEHKIAGCERCEVKSLSTYMSLYQLIPYKRVEDFFIDQIGLPISSGSIFNFNMEAYIKLQEFETQVKEKLLDSPLNHCDETGININGGKGWLH